MYAEPKIRNVALSSNWNKISAKITNTKIKINKNWIEI